MNTEIVRQIAAILQQAANQRKLVSYPRFHSLFAKSEPQAARLAALSDAIRSLSDCKQVDYGCLMALDGGLPGEDFFARYKGNRRREFEAIMGAGSLGRSTTKRRLLADAERQRVFEHAARPRRTVDSVSGDRNRLPK